MMYFTPQQVKVVRQKGAAMLLFVLFFSFAAGAMVFGFNQSMFVDLSDHNQLQRSKQAFFSAESALEDLAFRHSFGFMSYDDTESVTIGGVTGYATSTYDAPSDVYTITSSAKLLTVVRNAQAELTVGAGSSFNNGLQVGNGGVALSNGSDIFGNVYSNGAIIGQGSATVFGDIVSAGPSGLAQDIYATGTIYANTIDGIDADGDAHFNVQVGSDGVNPVGGTRFTPVTNQPLVDLPISTTTIQEWKDVIGTYGTVIASTDTECLGGTYTIDSDITIGYLKIECDVDIRKQGASTVITLDGPIWVEGNLSFTQGPEIQVHPSLGRRSVQMIADDETNRATSSQIEIRNSTDFAGSGDYRSYIMLLSMNESASSSGSEPAITVSQSANGDVIVYAASGLVDIGNNIDLRAVTGYQIDVANGSSITYEDGLKSLLFTSGPGGGYRLIDWQQQ